MEGDETIVVSGKVSDLKVRPAVITIIDNDCALLSIIVPSNMAEESEAAFTVTLSADYNRAVIVLRKARTGTAGEQDYSTTHGHVAFPPNWVFSMNVLGRYQVCARKDGSIILPDVLTRTFNKILKSCGIPGVRFHDLKHTHTTVLLTSGAPVHVVSARLGHASIQTTVDTYGHVIPASGVEAGRVIEQRLVS